MRTHGHIAPAAGKVAGAFIGLLRTETPPTGLRPVSTGLSPVFPSLSPLSGGIRPIAGVPGLLVLTNSVLDADRKSFLWTYCHLFSFEMLINARRIGRNVK